eukprot:gene27510-33229_t
MGVKDLWQLLGPMGRRVSIETLEGQALAIDMSIWLTQFIKAMRDDEGKMIKNAPIIGTLRRILKLLFHGIRPVFVFDGRTPQLKERVLERRRKTLEKSEANRRATAHKIILNQLKKHVLGHLNGPSIEAPQNTNFAPGFNPPDLPTIASSSPQPASSSSHHSNIETTKPANDDEHDDIAWQEGYENLHAKALDSSGEESADGGLEDNWALPDNYDEFDVDVLASLPAHMRKSIIEDARRRERQKARSSYLPLSHDPMLYSQTQIANFLNASRLNRRLVQAQASKEAQGQDEGKKIAAQGGRRYKMMSWLARGGAANGVGEDTSPGKARAEDNANQGNESEEEEEEVGNGGGWMDSTDDEAESSVRANHAENNDSDVIVAEEEEQISEDSRPVLASSVAPIAAQFVTEPGMLSSSSSKPAHSLSPSQLASAPQSALISATTPALAPPNATPSGDSPAKVAATPSSVHYHAGASSAADGEPDPTLKLVRGFWGDVQGSYSDEDEVRERENGDEEEEDIDWQEEPQDDVVRDDDIGVQEVGVVDIEVILEEEVNTMPSHPPSAPSPSPPPSNPQPSSRLSPAVLPPHILSRAVEVGMKVGGDWGGREVRRVLKSLGLQVGVESNANDSHEKLEESSSVREIGETKDAIELSHPVDVTNDNPEDDGNDFEEKLLSYRLAADQDSADNWQPSEEPGEASYESSQLETIEDEAALYKRMSSAARDAEKLTEEMKEEVMALINAFNLPYLVAPFEAEAQCAVLEQLGLVDGVVTEDSDVFLFGAKKVYKNMFTDKKMVEVYVSKELQSEGGLGRAELVTLACFLGSDYTEGVHGVGVVNAMEILRAFKEDGDEQSDIDNDAKELEGRIVKTLQRFKDWIDGYDFASELLADIDKKNSKGTGAASIRPSTQEEALITFSRKHRSGRAKWQLPNGFPDQRVIQAYLNPVASHDMTAFTHSVPDSVKVKAFCKNVLGYTDDMLARQIDPVLHSYSIHLSGTKAASSSQRLLSSYFVSYETGDRAAHIKSERLKEAVAGITKNRGVSAGISSVAEENTKKKRKRKSDIETS